MMNNYILLWDFLQRIQPLNHITQKTCFLSNHSDKYIQVDFCISIYTK